MTDDGTGNEAGRERRFVHQKSFWLGLLLVVGGLALPLWGWGSIYRIDARRLELIAETTRENQRDPSESSRHMQQQAEKFSTAGISLEDRDRAAVQ